VSNLAPRMRDVASILVLPLQVAGRSGDKLPLGAVLLAYADPQTFPPEALETMEQVSTSLAQTLHRQRTLTEAQRKAQENNILQQAGELIHSSLEQDEVIHTILQQWSSLMPGISHSILLRRDGNVTVVGAEGETRLTAMQGQFFPVSGVNPISVVLHSGKPLKIKHGRGEYNNLPDEVFTPNCVWLGVPLPYRGRVIGLLMAEHHKVHDYSPGQVRLAHLFARQVAAALEHARLYAREQNRVRELNALQKATAALLSTLNLEELLGQILDAAIMALPGSTHGSIYLIAPQTGKLQIRAMYGPAATRGHQIALITSEPYVIRAVTERKPILIPVIEDSEPTSGTAPASRPLSAMVAPLLLRERVVGALFVGAGEPHAYSSENLSLLESFATTATEAIHNAMLHAEVKSYAITDPLTGLYNRRGLFELGEPEAERARRFKRPLTLIMFDVDNFKLINDRDGHDAGDEILREIASRCRKFSRSMDILGRVGGDEFVLILLEADLHAAQEIAQRLLNGIGGQPVQLPNGAKRVTVSMGVSLASSGSPDLASIIKAADTAMYASKAQGGNCISIR
jgi:diguanylate cyclase (GGDEF)-like protein